MTEPSPAGKGDDGLLFPSLSVDTPWLGVSRQGVQWPIMRDSAVRMLMMLEAAASAYATAAEVREMEARKCAF